MESIREIVQKIKSFLVFPPTDMIIVAIIILVGVASFGLGRLSVSSKLKTPVTIIEGSQTASVVDSTLVSPQQGEGNVVASKNGTKYHFPWCSGAQKITEQNLITFNSTEEAKSAGYTPAANCKGLE